MPIIDHLDVESIGPDERTQATDEERIAVLEQQVRTLQASYRDLARHCIQLEQACAVAFAECPGSAPFSVR